jgi:hypothetical protein
MDIAMAVMRFFGNTMKCTALLVIIFLIFLGMRNPWLEFSSGPKKNPRAVLSQSATKSFTSVHNACGTQPKTSTGAVTLVAVVSPLWSDFLSSPLICSDMQIVFTSSCTSFLSSRAPPLLTA